MALCPTVHDEKNYSAYKKAQKSGRTDWSLDAKAAFEDEAQRKEEQAKAAEEIAAKAAAAARSAPGRK